ncbi:hypothetical protein GE061_002597 [Apolygus lucorum]|uniref:Hemolymph juvenile hormone binding protein n=1 Tax=Apolygus lucorum TaxID=248454 RepID=A0A8S9X5K0_APOLU|nr:hypothetical protein GE061_002597 [Apolygus lucorum]
MAHRFLLGFLCSVFISSTIAKIPSYIHVCKRNDPELDKCVLNSVEILKPKLVKGIPELDIPALEPLSLKDLVLQHGGRALKFSGTNYIIHGASNYEIDDLKLDLPNKVFQVQMRFPKIVLDADYEVAGKFLSFNLQGKGPVNVVAENIDGKAILKGKQLMKNGKEYFILDSMDLKLNLKNYELKLSRGFFKDQAVTDAINVALHENKREIINLVRPRLEEVVKDVLLDTANKITNHFTYDELFPES